MLDDRRVQSAALRRAGRLRRDLDLDVVERVARDAVARDAQQAADIYAFIASFE